MVYGYYLKNRGSALFVNIPCPACEASSSMELQVVCKIWHVMFIPYYAGRKQVICRCKVCNQSYWISEFPEFADEATRLLLRTTRPWYGFIGLFLFLLYILLIVTAMYKGKSESHQKMNDSIQNLKVGDVIYYKLDKKGRDRTSMLVDSVTADTVWVYENELLTNGRIERIDKRKNYSKKIRPYTREELEKMIDENLIEEVYFNSFY